MIPTECYTISTRSLLALIEAVAKPNNYQGCLLNKAQTHLTQSVPGGQKKKKKDLSKI